MLGEKPVVHESARIRSSTLGRFTEVGERSLLTECSMGDYSYVVNDCEIIYAQIGKFASIASHCRINPGNHPMERASQSHFTYRSAAYFEGEGDEHAYFDRRRSRPVSIGHDVWIGHGAIILPGRRVADGAVVAAGSVVTKDVPPYTIVAGNPAVPIRPRFSADVAARLGRLAWWDWSHSALHAALQDFRTLSVEAFLAAHEEKGSRQEPDSDASHA